MFCGFQNLYPDFFRVGVVLPAWIGNTEDMTTNNTDTIDYTDPNVEIDESLRTVEINGRTYHKRRLASVRDGDVVLASYEGGDPKWNIRGGFAFDHRVSDLVIPFERQYNRIQRWEVADYKNHRGFTLQRAKSGTRPNYSWVDRRSYGFQQFVWVEVK